MNDLISVIIPVYNVEKYLARCMDSILSQSYAEFEAILVNDGSTDSSGRLCDEWALKDGRIRVIHKENGGLSSARNAGLCIAKGEYFAFVDSDDAVDKDFLQKLYTALKSAGADIAICGKKVFSSENNLTPRRYDSLQIETLTYNDYLRDIFKYHDTYIPTWNKLYKKSVFDGLTFPVGKLHEDTFTTPRCMERAKVIARIPDELYFYFYNDGGIAHSRFSVRRFDDVEAHLIIFDEVKSRGIAEALAGASMWLIDFFIKVLSRSKKDIIDYPAVKKELKRRYKTVRKKLLKEGVLRSDWRFAVRLSRVNIRIIKLHRKILKVAYKLCKRK